jgi:hypothetical protein
VEVRGDPEDPRKVEFEVRFGDSHQAERQFDHAPARCADLHAVVGLAIAIALDDTLAIQLTKPPPTKPEPRPPAQAGPYDLPPAPPPEVAPPPPPLRGPLVIMSAAPLVLINVLPGAVGGADLGFELGFGRRLSSDLRLSGWFVHGNERTLLDGSADMTLPAGALDVCLGSPRGPRVRARLCAGMTAGAIFAFGREFEQNLRTTQPWAAARVGAELDFTLWRRLGLRAGLASVVPVVNPTFVVENPGAEPSEQQLSPVGALAHVGLRIRLR